MMWFIYAVLIINLITGGIHLVAYILGSDTAAAHMQWPALYILVCSCTIEIVREIRKSKGG